MKTKYLLVASALFMGAVGLAASFLPQEILAAAGLTAHGAPVLVVQVFGAAYLGFAMLNWMAKDSAMGGIYNRPLALGNTLHFAVAAMALLKGASSAQQPAVWTATACYAVFAILFTVVLFNNPGTRGETAQ
jgi:hypothetical protein